MSAGVGSRQAAERSGGPRLSLHATAPHHPPSHPPTRVLLQVQLDGLPPRRAPRCVARARRRRQRLRPLQLPHRGGAAPERGPQLAALHRLPQLPVLGAEPAELLAPQAG